MVNFIWFYFILPVPLSCWCAHANKRYYNNSWKIAGHFSNYKATIRDVYWLLRCIISKKIRYYPFHLLTFFSHSCPYKSLQRNLWFNDKIFQTFFTTKPIGQGTGSGSKLIYDIIKAHSEEIKVEPKEGKGAEFIIQLSTNASRWKKYFYYRCFYRFYPRGGPMDNNQIAPA